MRLLLDTHVWLWTILDPFRLSDTVRQLLEDDENELWLSAVSVWEAHLLAEQGKIRLDDLPAQWLDRELARFPLRDACLTRQVAIESRAISLPHREDPADRFIIATANVYDLDLVTADHRILDATACRLVRASGPPRQLV